MTAMAIPLTRQPPLARDDAASRQLAESETHYRIGPVLVSIRSDRPGFLSAFHDLYGPYRTRTAEPPDFEIEIETRRSWRSMRRYHHVSVNGEEAFAVREADSVLPHIEWALNMHVIRSLPGCLQIHAAVMSSGGVGVVFAGRPGQGKSTLAAALLARGWSYLSDEFAMIDPLTRRLMAYPKAICIKAGSFAPLRKLGLPLEGSRIGLKGAKGRVLLLDPLRVRRDAVSPPCPVGLIVFPEYGGGAGPAAEPVSRARTMFELTQVAFNLVKFRTRGMELLCDVVRGAECYRLRTGDLSETCHRVEALLRRATARDARKESVREPVCA